MKTIVHTLVAMTLLISGASYAELPEITNAQACLRTILNTTEATARSLPDLINNAPSETIENLLSLPLLSNTTQPTPGSTVHDAYNSSEQKWANGVVFVVTHFNQQNELTVQAATGKGCGMIGSSAIVCKFLWGDGNRIHRTESANLSDPPPVVMGSMALCGLCSHRDGSYDSSADLVTWHDATPSTGLRRAGLTTDLATLQSSLTASAINVSFDVTYPPDECQTPSSTRIQ